MALIDVPPPIRPTLNVVRGEVGHLQIGDARHGAAQGMNRVDRAERSEAVPARAL